MVNQFTLFVNRGMGYVFGRDVDQRGNVLISNYKLIFKDGAILTLIASSGWWTDFIEPFLSFVALATAAGAGIVKLLIVMEDRRRQRRNNEAGTGSDK